MTSGFTLMGSKTGDIFWDLAPWITYNPGYDLGCSIYVANPSETEKEYSLIARLAQGTTIISEEALPVFGFSWFKVAPDDFIRLKGALRFDDSNCELAILLVERETEEVIDSVVTVLVSPENVSALPPSWPVSAGSSGFDWSSLLYLMVPMMMLGVVISAARPKENEKEPIPVVVKE
jgi:hypothetical protein